MKSNYLRYQINDLEEEKKELKSNILVINNR